MSLIHVNWNPTRYELRNFAWLWLACLGVLGILFAWRSGAFDSAEPLGWGGPWKAPLALWTAAVAVWALGVAYAPAMRPVYLALMALSFPVGWTISHVLLILTYYGVFTAVGMALRLSGRDPMSRRFEPGATTYWTCHERVTDVKRYFRQF